MIVCYHVLEFDINKVKQAATNIKPKMRTNVVKIDGACRCLDSCETISVSRDFFEYPRLFNCFRARDLIADL